jgi:hypothetical protein
VICSEEYEPDARFNQEATSLDGSEATSLAKIDAEGYDRLVQFVRYFGLYYGNYTMEKTRTVFKCVFNGPKDHDKAVSCAHSPRSGCSVQRHWRCIASMHPTCILAATTKCLESD